MKKDNNIKNAEGNNMAKLTVLSFGGGQDSTAILYKYIYDADFRAKYAPEDFLVIMSDTGDEHASTYKHVRDIELLCKEHSIAFVLITEDMGYHGSWGNLRSFYRRTNTIGSKAYPKTCTDKLKLRPIYNYLENHLMQTYGENLVYSSRKTVYHSFAEEHGKIDVLLGIAKGEEKRLPDPAKADKLPKWQQASINKVYPLIDLGMDRQACQDYIRSVGHTVPTPSNCVLCPWMNEIELVYLHRFHRTDYEEWVELENNKIQANLHMGDKNLGVWGSKAPLPEWLKVAVKKYGHMSDEELQEYKMSHGHCVASKY
jgi:3'-phosphoadenosine 5'-phosphosulfate sulfotransferase (PAPS reductase)/FAD synthetase